MFLDARFVINLVLCDTGKVCELLVLGESGVVVTIYLDGAFWEQPEIIEMKDNHLRHVRQSDM